MRLILTGYISLMEIYRPPSMMVQELIQQEDPKAPLSDSAIKDLLQQQGIEIARRTVAKYREAMNIGSSTKRKVKF